MRVIWSVCPLVLMILIICPDNAVAQRSEAITADDIREYIAASKASGERWGAGEERYVLDNFSRPQLVQTLNNWQARNRTRLAKDVKITILVDYLLTELNGMRALSSVLDAASEGKSASFAKQLKTQVAASNFREYQFARIRVEVNLATVDVEIDGRAFPQVQNRSMFTVAAARPHVVVVTNGTNKCSNTITPEAGKIAVMPCTLP